MGFVVVGAIFGLVTGVLSPDVAPVETGSAPVFYEAAHTLRFEQNITPGALPVQVLPLTHSAGRTVDGEVPEHVADALGITTEEASSRIRVHVDSDLLMVLVAVAPTPSDAIRLVDEYAEQLIALYERAGVVIYEDNLQKTQGSIERLNGEIAELRVDLLQAEGLLNLTVANDLKETISTKEAQLIRADNRPLQPFAHR